MNFKFKLNTQRQIFRFTEGVMSLKKGEKSGKKYLSIYKVKIRQVIYVVSLMS